MQICEEWWLYISTHYWLDAKNTDLDDVSLHLSESDDYELRSMQADAYRHKSLCFFLMLYNVSVSQPHSIYHLS